MLAHCDLIAFIATARQDQTILQRGVRLASGEGSSVCSGLRYLPPHSNQLYHLNTPAK